MKVIRLEGWALIVSAVLGLVGLVWSTVLSQPNSLFFNVIWFVGIILFVVGLPAIQATQPKTGRLGQIGLVLMGIGALIALVVTIVVRFGGSDVGDTLPLISALVGAVGRIIVGYLTIQARVFPAWVGRVLIIDAVCNVLGGVVPSVALILGIISALADAAALIGYGFTIVQQRLPLSASNAR